MNNIIENGGWHFCNLKNQKNYSINIRIYVKRTIMFLKNPKYLDINEKKRLIMVKILLMMYLSLNQINNDFQNIF